MEFVCVAIGAFWVLAIIIGIIKKVLGLDDESKAKQAVEVAQAGFVEMFGKALGAIAAIGAHAASSDGSVSSDERAVVSNWLKERIDDLKDEYQADMRRYSSMVYGPNSGRLSDSQLRQMAQSIPEEAGEFRQEAIQLAFKVVASDGVLSPGEYQTLQGIQNALEISDSRFRDLYDLHLAQLRRPGASGGQGPQVDELGLDPSWPKERKLAHLLAEFSKYNARMQSVRDEAQRAHCKRMIDLITRTKAELEGTLKPKKSNPDEVLLGINSDLSVQDKKLTLEHEESRWIARQRVTQTPSGLQKCKEALEAAARLRATYAQAA
jgi:tellurite resistance protein